MVVMMCFHSSASALSLSLDSVAEWGKFPRFCVNTYRWADKFFNSYDSAYVVGTGMKFNVKAVADSYVDYYRFRITDGKHINLVSDASTSLGVHLTYMAVTVGYNVNASKLLGIDSRARKHYELGLNCSLFSVEGYWEENEVGTRMTRFGDYSGKNIEFSGVDVRSWGLDAYYFFNNKRYSQAAAFSYGKIQKKSQGSFYAGFSIYTQKYDFDFNSLPQYMIGMLPIWWRDNHFKLETKNIGFRLGYAHNWVLGSKWTFAISESPIIGTSKGFINSEKEEFRFSVFNRFRMSAVWNYKRWFAGFIGEFNTAIVSDRETVFLSNAMNFTCAVGYRFNLW